MRVGDSDGQRIGRIGTGDRHAWQEARNHGVNLHFLGRAIADDGFLDQPGGIFADLQPGAGSNHQDYAAGLAELERRLRVLVDEHFLNRGAVRLPVGDQGFNLRREVRQPRRQRLSSNGLELAVGDVAKAIALGFDQAPAGRTEARIQAEDDQPSFSNSASLIS